MMPRAVGAHARNGNSKDAKEKRIEDDGKTGRSTLTAGRGKLDASRVNILTRWAGACAQRAEAHHRDIRGARISGINGGDNAKFDRDPMRRLCAEERCMPL